jgi:glucose 1-dehydrogenase
MQLEHKVAIVTGAATGIGKAIATQMALDGAAVAIDYVKGQQDKAQGIVDQITRDGGKALAIEVDVTKEDQVKSLIERTADTFGRLDIMVNNAGVEQEHPFLEMPLDVWNWVIAVDLTGPWLCSQAAARQMVQQGDGGRIINISSVHEDLPMPTNAPYCAAKGGLRMLMRTIAVELAPHGITVNNIGPGAIDTDLDAPTINDPSKYARLLSEIPLHRVGQPSEVAHLAAFLASDAAAYITGSTYFIDGGMLRQSGSL